MKKRGFITTLAAIMISACCAVPVFAGELESGSYSMKQGEKSVNVYVDKISSAENFTAINMYKSDDSNTQDFILEKQPDGSYKICIAKPGYTLNVKELKVNTDVIVYKDKKANTEYYTIEETEKEGFYTIRMKNKSSLALTSTGKTGLTLKTYNGNDNQQFYFESNDAGESAGNVDPVGENVLRQR